MKKIQAIGRVLSPSEKRLIIGGDDPVGSLGGDDSSCTATCSPTKSVSCSGTGCHADDGKGCYSDTEKKSC